MKYIRVDEDGALSRSEEFCKVVRNSNIVLHTTGGYASNKNGKAASIVGANLSIDFWCFALQHANHSIRNLSLCYDKAKTAREVWSNKKPHWKDFRIPFCHVYIFCQQ